jgi:hypothetical protein
MVVCERMVCCEWVSEIGSECVSEKMSGEWESGEWMSCEWVSEWVSYLVYEWRVREWWVRGREC